MARSSRAEISTVRRTTVRLRHRSDQVRGVAGRRRGWEHRGRHVSSCRRVVLNDAPGRLHRAQVSPRSEDDPPTTWDIHGIDGPIRAIVGVTVEATQVVAPHAPLLAIGAASWNHLGPTCIRFQRDEMYYIIQRSASRARYVRYHWWRHAHVAHHTIVRISPWTYVCALPRWAWPTSTVGVNAHPATELRVRRELHDRSATRSRWRSSFSHNEDRTRASFTRRPATPP